MTSSRSGEWEEGTEEELRGDVRGWKATRSRCGVPGGEKRLKAFL